MATPAGDPEKTARVESDAQYKPRHTVEEAQFAPGTIIAGRYRVAGFLGAGGMGEVYRAEDTKLGQTVAVKVLPARLARDTQHLGRLHDEVRLGRQIAHPNVCRIYDIAEYEGSHFVAMEYVDGEDLSRLLKRIGRLAADKAIEIARGITAGLAAAHAKGILHRDLKPPNIMVDSQGDAKIMDFGLALGMDEEDGTISGTPAYMAPEQLRGDAATVQSDLYSLGLVMYELFTGRRAISARTLPERVRDLASDITTPSSVIRDIDPSVERVILRCLSNDPTQRPRSAREVINALPGGDPLAAALAAGETPSPRIVAASGTAGSLRPIVAWGLLALVVISFATIFAYRLNFSLLNLSPVQKHPEVMSEQAREILRGLGIPQQPFTSRMFGTNRAYQAWIFRSDPSPRRWQRVRQGPPVVLFRYEEAAAPRLERSQTPAPGTSEVTIDRKGRLVDLQVVPREEWKARPLDWTPLFATAGLDRRTFQPATPKAVPRAAIDARAAWSGKHPDDGTPIRIEAAAWRGTPVFFHLGGAWDASANAAMPFSNRNLTAFLMVVVVSITLIGLVVAWRNARARRGDRQAAFRAAAAVFVLDVIAQLLGANHQPSGGHEVEVLEDASAQALLWAAIVYVLYLALEPFVRRRWPELLIASTRLLSGDARDPMIGRDVLIGIAGGLAHPALICASHLFSAAMQTPSDPPNSGMVSLLTAPRFLLAHLFDSASRGVIQGFLMTVILAAFLLVLRRRLYAAAGLVAIMFAGYYFATGGISIAMVAITAIITTIAVRYGLLALAVAQATFFAIFNSPQFAGGSWFTLTGMIPVALVVAAAVWAFRTSLGGQQAFAATAFDE